MNDDTLTLDKIMAAMRSIEALSPGLLELRESRALVVSKSRELSWRERLLSWPWKPWRRLKTWTEPDPNLYRMPKPALLGGPSGEMLVGHPVTVARLRSHLSTGDSST